MQTQVVNIIRVLLGVPHAGLRWALRQLLETMDGVEIVGEVGECSEAIDLARQLKPDVALIDFGLPDMGGLDVTAAMVREAPETRVMLLGNSDSSDEQEYREAAMACGASAYLAKVMTPTYLRQSLLDLVPQSQREGQAT